MTTSKNIGIGNVWVGFDLASTPYASYFPWFEYMKLKRIRFFYFGRLCVGVGW